MKCVNCGCDAEAPDRGRLINRRAYLGSQILSMRERIAAWEKQARKTPAKTLVAEWKKVQDAKTNLEVAKPQLDEMVSEWNSLKETLDALQPQKV